MMRRIKRAFRSTKAKVAAVAAGVVVGAQSASAAAASVYDQSIDVSTTEVLLIAGVVIAGSAVIWGIRKSVALTNKS